MAINSGIPNQTGLDTTYIFTAAAPGGTPGPASAPASSLLVAVPNQASAAGGDAQQVAAATETLASAGITVPVEQILGESQEAGLFASIEASAPTAGVPPTPAPTVKEFTGTASDGNQPSVSTPFTGTGWGTKSVV